MSNGLTKAKPRPDWAKGCGPVQVCNTSISGITLKDIREMALKMPHLPRLEWVRVSDGWWVALEDGKPISLMPHNELMRVIEENCQKVP